MKQPETNLPWKIRDKNVVDSQDYALVASYESYITQKDMEYLVEACNNSPKAIELLKNHKIVYESSNFSKIVESYKEIEDFLKSLENQ